MTQQQAELGRTVIVVLGDMAKREVLNKREMGRAVVKVIVLDGTAAG